jgi:hypothetical protein
MAEICQHIVESRSYLDKQDQIWLKNDCRSRHDISVCDSDGFGIRRVTRGGYDVCVNAMSQNHVCKRVDGWKAAA